MRMPSFERHDSEDMLDLKYLRSNSIMIHDDNLVNQSLKVHQLFADEPSKPSEYIINTKN